MPTAWVWVCAILICFFFYKSTTFLIKLAEDASRTHGLLTASDGKGLTPLSQESTLFSRQMTVYLTWPYVKMLDSLNVSWPQSTAKNVPPCKSHNDKGNDVTDTAIIRHLHVKSCRFDAEQAVAEILFTQRCSTTNTAVSSDKSRFHFNPLMATCIKASFHWNRLGRLISQEHWGPTI